MSDNEKRLEEALYAIRNAAAGAQQFTNRLQFIYERANCALRGEEWNETWKAQYGYRIRNAILRDNERLQQRVAELEAHVTLKEPTDRNDCEHNWVDATNEVVSGTDLCIKCYAVRAKP